MKYKTLITTCLTLLLIAFVSNKAIANGYDDEVKQDHMVQQLQDWDNQQKKDAERRYDAANTSPPSSGSGFLAILFLVGIIWLGIAQAKHVAKRNNAAEERKLREKILMEQKVRDQILKEQKKA